jgi:hypothetical protein
MGLRGAIHSLAVVAVLALPASAAAYDTGPHSDITRDALRAEGFGATAADVAVVSNFFVDLYSNSSKIPQSGHASTGKEVLGSLFGPRENWPDSLLDAANRLHFDASLWDVFDVQKAEQEWNRLQRATAQLLRSIDVAGAQNREMQVLVTIGMGLHALQDFYSHSTWIEQQGMAGIAGPNWAQHRFGSNPTWFDVPKETRDALTVYIGDSTGHKDRPHGAWNTKRQHVDGQGRQQGLAGPPRLRQQLHRVVLRDAAVGAGDEGVPERQRAVVARHGVRRPPQRRARPRPQVRDEDRDDDRPLVGPGRAVRRLPVARRLRVAQRPRRRPDRRAQRAARLLRPVALAVPQHVPGARPAARPRRTPTARCCPSRPRVRCRARRGSSGCA